jgi:exodeoxyribonuclease V beta subunit
MSQIPDDFLLESTPLNPGVTMLEASAGTGKTFTICGIVVRLVAVEGLPIDRILVVTFTEAATRELRDRTRRRLREIEQALSIDSSKDSLVASLRASGVADEVLLRRIRLAIASFDEASIATIHGFCQQVLRDNAFEGDMPFEAEVLTDPRGLYRDLAHDFWRLHLQTVDPILPALARARSLLPAELVRLIERIMRRPNLRILPEDPVSLQEAGKAVVEGYQVALQGWRVEGMRLSELLRTHTGLSRDKEKGLSLSRLSDIAAALDDAIASGIMTTAAINALRDLSKESIKQRHKKTAKARYPDEPWHALCSAFATACDRWAIALRSAWFAFAAQELRQRKAARKVITFDDMLSQTHAALHGTQGNALVTLIRKRWQAALIDEFQDTDPLQYDIFRRCFALPPHRLLLIGDPKQSIYGFRGADLFTYLAAKRDIATEGGSNLYTLRRNFRSTSALVDAVNAVFTRVPQCFMQAGIDFIPAIADGTRAAKTPLTRDGAPIVPPLTLVEVPADASADEARQRIAEHVAAEITRILAGGYRLGDRAVSATDIAVLVRTHREAVIVQDALRAAGLSSVRRTSDSVFDTDEAVELVRILEALLEPGRTRRLKTALAGSCFGLNANDLLALDTDPVRCGDWTRQFDALHQRWHQQGFAAAFRDLLITFDVHARLVGEVGGERRLTNFLHLAELVHRAERTLRLAPSTVVRWIRAQQQASTNPADEVLQRLERDDDAVQIVTVHNAKGLEYPIVFCPMHWSEPYVPETIFHDPEDGHRLTLDLSKPTADAHKQRAITEQLAEDVRLLYVSLTRAVHRGYLYLHRSSRIKHSALLQVLGNDLSAAARELVDREPHLFEHQPLQRSTSSAHADNANHPDKTTLGARRLARTLAHEPMIGSFTRLVANAPEETAQDHDAGSEIETLNSIDSSASSVAPIFELAPGAATGTALHAVLEHADFTQANTLAPLVAKHFAPLKLTADMQAVVTQQLTLLLEHPLQADARTLRLRDIPNSARVNEIEFYYPIRKFAAAELALACAPRGPASTHWQEALHSRERRIGRLRFDPVEGYLRGFIDAILHHEGRYYLVDWKSNLLGKSTADYEPARLAQAMASKFYDLQSWLYAVALDRHLATRLRHYRYEDHFGGIFYIFVRGLDPVVPTRGVHFERPDAAFVRNLAATLSPATRVQA